VRAGALVISLLAFGCDYHGRTLDNDAGGGDDIADAAGDDTIDAAGDIDATIVTIDAAPDIDATPDGSPDAAPAACPDGYAPLAGAPTTSAYRVVMGFVNWGPAEVDCDNDGAGTHLVVIDDAAESTAIDAAFFGDLWIGASDRVSEGSFLAITGGAMPYASWGLFQPDDLFGQDCAGLDEGGSYSDRDCGATRGFVCECDGVEPDPAAF
jgi:hypothetical protein